jgi:hypothetical protein
MSEHHSLSTGLDRLPSQRIVATFIVDPFTWDLGRIRFTCSLCGGAHSAGPTSNPNVHADMRQHLKQKHAMRGTSLLRSETVLDDIGAISSVDFFRP